MCPKARSPPSATPNMAKDDPLCKACLEIFSKSKTGKQAAEIVPIYRELRHSNEGSLMKVFQTWFCDKEPDDVTLVLQALAKPAEETAPSPSQVGRKRKARAHTEEKQGPAEENPAPSQVQTKAMDVKHDCEKIFGEETLLLGDGGAHAEEKHGPAEENCAAPSLSIADKPVAPFPDSTKTKLSSRRGAKKVRIVVDCPDGTKKRYDSMEDCGFQLYGKVHKLRNLSLHSKYLESVNMILPNGQKVLISKQDETMYTVQVWKTQEAGGEEACTEFDSIKQAASFLGLSEYKLNQLRYENLDETGDKQTSDFSIGSYRVHVKRNYDPILP